MRSLVRDAVRLVSYQPAGGEAAWERAEEIVLASRLSRPGTAPLDDAPCGRVLAGRRLVAEGQAGAAAALVAQ